MFISYFILAIINVGLWTPIALKFYGAWKKRRNPISLAICLTIMLILWGSIGGIWIVTDSVNAKVANLSMTAMSTAVAFFAHVAFHWSDRKFSGDREG